MRRTLKAVGAAAAAATCVLAATSGTAHAEAPKQAALYAPSALVLTVGQGEDATSTAVERAVTLTCAPRPGGTHPAAAAACAELTKTGGQFAQLVGSTSDVVCTKEWRPVTVSVTGVWSGKHIGWSTTFANRCEMKAGLGEGAALAF
ncbi:SSI family serine proteinase inhibitor [Streptomyces sp. NRRL S-1521]|uniref:SSI family serine proteinase inhibitor n=1 Tax=Streptomyces sp. NRRL S-1521 TaxID=1609100 RepID=UPI000748A394|nr:SSI family serine proteinase inhibitor [Streptomyces sp. NRRL S-1521]KUL54147.1 protease inhibitor protein [Streptomyces sp. NRRL S-1521]